MTSEILNTVTCQLMNTRTWYEKKNKKYGEEDVERDFEITLVTYISCTLQYLKL